MFTLWYLLNLWLLFLFCPTRAYYREWDHDVKSSFRKPNIYVGTIDSYVVILVQIVSINDYEYDRNQYMWSNTNIDKNEILWSISSSKCKNDFDWPKKLTLREPNAIPTIPKEMFKRIHVRQFHMQNLNLQSISKEDFKNGFFLELVNLSNNSITSIPSFVFAYTPEITEIYLSNNNIEDIAENAFEKDPSVHPLADFQTHCRDSYHSLFNKVNNKKLDIKVLHLDNNRLSSISPKWFESLETLYEVSLSNNRIQMVDATVIFSKNLHLKDLNLSKNQIKDATKLEFKTLIEKISISNNPIESPINLYANTAYTLMWNIKHIDTHITISSDVRFLDAGNNSIISVTAQHPTNSSLTFLKLDNNKLTSISNISAFRSLEVLILAKNLLTNFESTVYEQLPYLRELDLSYNKIKHFEMNIVMKELKTLRLAGNGLTTLDTNLKSMAPAMVGIGLMDNNWNCEHLTTLLLLLHFDGISPIQNESLNRPESYKQIKYDDKVKGIHCFNNVESTTIFPSDAKWSNELKNEVQQMLEEKLSKLQEKLLEILDKSGKN